MRKDKRLSKLENAVKPQDEIRPPDINIWGVGSDGVETLKEKWTWNVETREYMVKYVKEQKIE